MMNQGQIPYAKTWQQAFTLEQGHLVVQDRSIVFN